MSERKVGKVWSSTPTVEGAGVNLERVFGYNEKELLDPFLLLDDFHSEDPDDYISGFPWHPHRGIETVTYMVRGEVEHGDSMGNTGVIRSGDVQWMTAGAGIIHQEMPKEYDGPMQGFQLWVNLPRSNKMMDPRYRELKKESIPEINLYNGVRVKVLSGELGGIKGPVKDLVVDISYLDISMDPGSNAEFKIKPGYTAFAYVYSGSGRFGAEKTICDGGKMMLFEDGESISVSSDIKGVGFLLISGKPIREDIAWGGPIVMNTKEELETAFREYSDGTFIKKKGDN